MTPSVNNGGIIMLLFSGTYTAISCSDYKVRNIQDCFRNMTSSLFEAWNTFIHSQQPELVVHVWHADICRMVVTKGRRPSAGVCFDLLHGCSSLQSVAQHGTRRSTRVSCISGVFLLIAFQTSCIFDMTPHGLRTCAQSSTSQVETTWSTTL